MLDGKLPDGTEIPVFSFDEFKRGVADLPMRYGVISDFEMLRKSTGGDESFDVLKDEPNMIVRAGGVEPLAAYLERRGSVTTRGSWGIGTHTTGSTRNKLRLAH